MGVDTGPEIYRKIGTLPINYTYTVTNTGDVNLSDLKIEDDRLGLIDKRE